MKNNSFFVCFIVVPSSYYRKRINAAGYKTMKEGTYTLNFSFQYEKIRYTMVHNV